ncbi:MAG: hypothetical protein A2X11_05320 [Bacteroidetes bacterium GWE2_42_24]|nr:MAG: hypothetical protein A2X11_05320 [Bacteroidetes bacterium GWE2_42_24]OFY26613.1 MAG: hypothetical protein A2X09_03245 [Bacteroidetes bacterium GWF2_43_11]
MILISLTTLKYLSLGGVFGLSAGLSPGPLLTLVISETMKHNRRAGIRVAISPLITDLPIILFSLLIMDTISQYNTVLGIISFAGALFIGYLGYETIRIKGISVDDQQAKPESLKKGVIANFLNPHPYLFWCTIGAPMILQAFGISLITMVLFLVAFYVMLIGAKITIVLLVSRSKALLRQRGYVLTMRVLGIILFLFSLFFIRDGISYLWL